KGFITKVQGKVDQAIDKVLKKAADFVKKMFGKLTGKKGEPPAEGSEEHKKAVTAALAMLTSETQARSKKGRIEEKEAKAVAVKVKGAHKILKSITVVDGSEDWNYDYVASPKKQHKGAHKGSGVLKIVKVSVKDPNVKGLLARAKDAVVD
ncbi:hypothetical protein AB4084_28055, partial [Lysobacter sp. 2RAB21]